MNRYLGVVMHTYYFQIPIFVYRNPNSPVSFKPYYDVIWPEYTPLPQPYLQMTSNMTSSSVKQALSGPAVKMLLSG